MPIERLSGLRTPVAPAIGAADAAGTPGFGEALGRMVRAVETTGAEANGAVASMVEGQGDVHEAMIALQRADLTLQLSVQIRNKLVQAYQEVMRMPV
jgi:flagellar hook-basal body complex protein FliE